MLCCELTFVASRRDVGVQVNRATYGLYVFSALAPKLSNQPVRMPSPICPLLILHSIKCY